MEEELTGIGQKWLAEHIFYPVEGVYLYIAIVGSLGLWALLIAFLQSLPPVARRRLTVVCTFLAGLFYSIEFFWPEQGNPLTGYIVPLGTFLRVMGGFTVGLGLISLCTVHGKAIVRRREGWINSLAFFVAMMAMIVAGFWQQYWPLLGSRFTEVPTEPGQYTFSQGLYEVLFNGMLNPLESTMFSILAFFIVSAAYRAFRIKSAEATLMMVAAFIVMLGQVPVGVILTNWIPAEGTLGFLGFFRLERLANWLLSGINAAAFRGILFGTMFGYLAISLRTWLSLERGAYFGQPM
ncbi:MAG TPA: hypothetical protein EYP85_11660 [Armatimonadetes bacterium]|nr:hypothetical protein [Armatimonadota bacterium]